MPGVIVFNRRWGIGSDDFVFPAAGELILRIAWVLVLAVVLAAHNDLLSICGGGHLLRVYYIGMLVLLSLSITLSAVTVYISSRGTIVDGTQRAKLPYLLYARIVFILPDLAWTAIGTKWAFDDFSGKQCMSDVVAAVRGAVIVGWLLQLALIVGVLVVFDPYGHEHSQLNLSASRHVWKLRCRLLCCCVTSSDQTTTAFDEVAQLLADYFHDIDVVATDIVAGLILTQHEQQMRATRLDADSTAVSTRSSASLLPTEATGSSTPHYHRPSWMTIQNAAHYMKFAGASYGWPFFVYNNLLCGPCRLWCDCRCCSCVRSSDNILDDNCCSCHVSAILQKTGIQRTDIVYANFTNKIYETPFYVAVDHKHQSVIVALRGTLSLEDALTDMMVNTDVVSVITDVNEAKAHSGILRAATYVANILSQKNVLQMAFDKAPGYQLVITGHSLGAGTAGLLAVLLRPQYSNLMCFAFSPPGWLVSLSLSQHMKQFVCSVVLGKDLVPRLGLVTMHRLKRQMIESLNSCPHPKYRILIGGVFHALCCGSNVTANDTHHDSSLEHQHLLSSHSCVQPRQYTDEQSSGDDSWPWTQTSLYLPGCILYIHEVDQIRGCCDRPHYSASWAEPELFDEILVGAKMVSDHMPDAVQQALELMAGESGSQHSVQTEIII
jgi:sn1-specific diacylglycerol lipase